MRRVTVWRGILGMALAATGCLGAESVELRLLGTYRTGVADRGAAVAAAFDPSGKRLLVANRAAKAVDVLDLAKPAQPRLVQSLSVTNYGFLPASIAVHKGVAAVAVESAGPRGPGRAVLFDVATGNCLASLAVGHGPKMLTFLPGQARLLVANSGEADPFYVEDPEGSLTLLDFTRGLTNWTATTIGFEAFNERADTLRAAGVRLFGPKATAAKDLEPDCIAVSPDGATAWVVLQVNNALATVDLKAGRVTDVKAFGVRDARRPGAGFDGNSRDDAIAITNWPVSLMYQPDSVALAVVSGRTFLVTANQGRARECPGYDERARVGSVTLDPREFPGAAALQPRTALGPLVVSEVGADPDGDGDYDRLLAFGARSLAVWTPALDLVAETGEALERLAAARQPKQFNAEPRTGAFDRRSNFNGPAPRSVAVAALEGGPTLAFVALQGIGGIVTFDLSDPARPAIAHYVNTRDFHGDVAKGTAGDVAPRGLLFIPAGESPNGKPLLVACHEISGTVTVFEISVRRARRG
jgi:DNA-binding beta-propeller fold protein YncE